MYLCQVKLKKALRVIEISLVVPSTEMEILGNIKQMNSDQRKGCMALHVLATNYTVGVYYLELARRSKRRIYQINHDLSVYCSCFLCLFVRLILNYSGAAITGNFEQEFKCLDKIIILGFQRETTEAQCCKEGGLLRVSIGLFCSSLCTWNVYHDSSIRRTKVLNQQRKVLKMNAQYGIKDIALLRHRALNTKLKHIQSQQQKKENVCLYKILTQLLLII